MNSNDGRKLDKNYKTTYLVDSKPAVPWLAEVPTRVEAIRAKALRENEFHLVIVAIGSRRELVLGGTRARIFMRTP